MAGVTSRIGLHHGSNSPVFTLLIPHLSRHEIPERHGITQAIDRRDAMLPLTPHGSAQEIG